MQEAVAPLLAHIVRSLPPIPDDRARRGHLSAFQPQHLAMALWALSTLGLQNSSVHVLAAPVLQRMRHHLADKGLAALAYAYANDTQDRICAAASQAVLHMVTQEVSARVQRGSIVPDALSEVLWHTAGKTILQTSHDRMLGNEQHLKLGHKAAACDVADSAQAHDVHALASLGQIGIPKAEDSLAQHWPMQLKTNLQEQDSSLQLSLRSDAVLRHHLQDIAESLADLPSAVRFHRMQTCGGVTCNSHGSASRHAVIASPWILIGPAECGWHKDVCTVCTTLTCTCDVCRSVRGSWLAWALCSCCGAASCLPTCLSVQMGCCTRAQT